MPQFKILTYSLKSEGYQRLRDALNATGIRPEGSRYAYRVGDVVLNWGIYGHRDFPIMANQPEAVYLSCHKRAAYTRFRERGVPTVEWTTDPRVAREWAEGGHRVYARSTESGSRGRGIQVLSGRIDLGLQEGAMVPAQFYTKGFPTSREFRIHCGFGKVIKVYEKKRRSGTTPDPFIRSHGDWVCCQYNLDPYPASLTNTALNAVAALGLDFAGVDVALSRNGDCCVFETNTAPGIENGSVEAYANLFKERFA